MIRLSPNTSKHNADRFVAPVKRTRILEEPMPTGPDDISQRRGVDNGQTIIVVLPFGNSDDKIGVDHVASSLTESIINNLSRLPQVRVMSRAAIFRYSIGRRAKNWVLTPSANKLSKRP